MCAFDVTWQIPTLYWAAACLTRRLVCMVCGIYAAPSFSFAFFAASHFFGRTLTTSFVSFYIPPGMPHHLPLYPSAAFGIARRSFLPTQSISPCFFRACVILCVRGSGP
jgi:hypothetical protein